MAGGSDEVDQTYSVHLVAANGREQAVALHIRRSGLWLYTQGGKVKLSKARPGPTLAGCVHLLLPFKTVLLLLTACS